MSVKLFFFNPLDSSQSFSLSLIFFFMPILFLDYFLLFLSFGSSKSLSHNSEFEVVIIIIIIGKFWVERWIFHLNNFFFWYPSSFLCAFFCFKILAFDVLLWIKDQCVCLLVCWVLSTSDSQVTSVFVRCCHLVAYQCFQAPQPSCFPASGGCGALHIKPVNSSSVCKPLTT